MNNSKRIYRAAIYVRLSKEDGDLDDVRKAESNSISNQKSLRRYAQCQLVGICVDFTSIHYHT